MVGVELPTFSPSPTRSLLVQHVTNLDTSKMCNQYGIKKGEPFFFCFFILGIPPTSHPELVNLLLLLALGFLC